MADIKGILPQVQKGKIYEYTGSCDRGFCYPMHVAAEAGHKDLVLLLHKQDGEQFDLMDDWDKIPEEKATGRAKEAFLEMKGFTKAEQTTYDPPGIASPNSEGCFGKVSENSESVHASLARPCITSSSMHHRRGYIVRPLSAALFTQCV